MNGGDMQDLKYILGLIKKKKKLFPNGVLKSLRHVDKLIIVKTCHARSSSFLKETINSHDMTNKICEFVPRS